MTDYCSPDARAAGHRVHDLTQEPEMSHGNPDITTELAARILRRVARIRRALRTIHDLDAITLYLNDIENLVHFGDPYGAENDQTTPRTFDPPVVQPIPSPASDLGIPDGGRVSSAEREEAIGRLLEPEWPYLSAADRDVMLNG